MYSDNKNSFKFDHELAELLYEELVGYANFFEKCNKENVNIPVWYPEFVNYRVAVPEDEVTKNSRGIDRLLPERILNLPHIYMEFISNFEKRIEIYIYEKKYKIDLSDPYYSKGDPMKNQLSHLTMSINESIIKFDKYSEGTYIL